MQLWDMVYFFKLCFLPKYQMVVRIEKKETWKFEIPQHLQNMVLCMLMKDVSPMVSVNYLASLL